MFKISGFYDEVSPDLNTQVKIIKKLNGKYICPRLIQTKNIASYTAEEFGKEILPVLMKNEIKISSIGSPIGKIDLNDSQAYASQLKKLKELVKIAEMANCKYIRCFSFFTGPNPTDRDLRQVVAKWRGFLEEVEGHNVTILHENEKKIFGDIPSRVLDLYYSLNHPQFKLCYDASNYIQCGVDPRDAFLKTKDYTVYYHMKDCYHGVEVPLGTGEGRIKELLADLVADDYTGFLTLEPHTAKYAMLKRFFAIIPFLTFTKMGRVFRKIGKDSGIPVMRKVTREEVMIMQHENLLKLIKEINGKYE
ncbi:MAG: sugar phosphate isomerase/epimerase [Christensenellaceae bacterium]|jgi:sugar phosphate isomerase/epimerase|nr:sugar phosphate isomerase/epimerase [Christensenellaceae bacterium]